MVSNQAELSSPASRFTVLTACLISDSFNGAFNGFICLSSVSLADVTENACYKEILTRSMWVNSLLLPEDMDGLEINLK
jgi:hypothetical protein